MALQGGLQTLRSLQALRELLKTSEWHSTQEIAQQLWSQGWPSRVIELPIDWWKQTSEFEAGTWIVANQQEPEHWWLVLQRKGKLQIHALTAPKESQTTPEDLQLQAVSLWPAMTFSSPARWDDLQLQLKPGVSICTALPATLVRTVNWLILLWLLIAVQEQKISIPLALILAALNILFGQLLDNQWNRLWLNRSERQRAALLLIGIQKVVRLPHNILKSIGHKGATALALTLQQIGHQLPLTIGRSLPAITLFVTSNLMLGVWLPALGAINTLATGLWFLINKILSQLSQIKETEKNIQQDLAQQRSKELIENCSTLRLGAAEQKAIKWWAEPQLAAHKQQWSLDWINTLQTWSTLVLATVMIGSSIKTAPTLTDQWLAFSLVAMQLASVWEIGFALKAARNLKQHWQVSQVLLNHQPEWRSGASNPGILKGELEAKNISFRYRSNKKLILSNINFTIQSGSFVAIVGSTGSGKSTLIRVLLGLEEPLQGQIFVDGHDYRELQRDLLRRQIGSVLQDTGLVGRTMMEVIAAGRPLSLEQAWSAAEDAGLGAELQTLPMGLQTLITAGGRNLSGGQRQRLAIARALAGNPRLLMLDEPTSALDNETQAHVLKKLEERAITRVMVAHRLSTIEQADVILVLEHGEIVEQGNYNDLLKRGGVFSQLISRQLVNR